MDHKKFMVRVCGANYENQTYGQWHEKIGEEAERLGWQFDHLGVDGHQLSRLEGEKIVIKHFGTLGELIEFLERV